MLWILLILTETKIGLVLSSSATFYLVPIHPLANFLTLFANIVYAILWSLFPPGSTSHKERKSEKGNRDLLAGIVDKVRHGNSRTSLRQYRHQIHHSSLT
jgi:hypothetical protein